MRNATAPLAVTMDAPAPSQKSFHCPYEDCPKRGHAYTRREKLNDHIRSKHTGLRFPCPDCSKLFVRVGDLKKHSVCVHGGRKDFVCEASLCGCGKRFTEKSSLNRHQQNFPTLLEHGPLLDRDVSELRSDPKLKAHFAEILEAQVETLQISILPDDQDGLLSRCAINEENSNDVRPATRPSDLIDNRLLSEDDAIDVALYQRMVSLFRSRRPRTLSELLADMVGVVQQANVFRVMRLIHWQSLLEGLDELLLDCSSEIFDEVFTFSSSLQVSLEGRKVSLTIDEVDICSLLSISKGSSPRADSDLAYKISEFRETQLSGSPITQSPESSKILGWAAELIVAQASRSNYFEKMQKGRASATLYEAHYAASCLLSLSAGHTDSVAETISMMPEKAPLTSFDTVPQVSAGIRGNAHLGLVIAEEDLRGLQGSECDPRWSEQQ